MPWRPMFWYNRENRPRRRKGFVAVEIRKIYLAGLGAIGGSYAARLMETDPDSIRIIVDRERRSRYERLGIAINGKAYPFRYVTPEESAEPADLILIAVKQYDLGECLAEIRPFVGEGTIILSLLNGITSEEIIGRSFGADRLLYSFVVGTDATREGNATTYSRLGTIVFGERFNQAPSAKVAAVKDLFDRTGIPYRIPEDMLRELWWKFMMNVGINQVSAVLRAPYGVFLRVPEARELMEAASGEVLALAERLGIDLRREDIQDYLRILTTLSPEGKTSMLQDVEAGRRTEVDIFAGTVAELGRKHGVATPVNDCLLRMLHAIEATYPRA